MENLYARALYTSISRGTPPKDAVRALHAALERGGRSGLLPRIVGAFERLARAESARTGVTLSVAREGDARHALAHARAALEELGAQPSDCAVRIDPALIGGWRLEGREALIDASYKKDLLALYSRVAGK